jgi:serine/threonine-protein kinase HipA
VPSAYTVQGDGLSKVSPFNLKMAMAVQATNTHWNMRDIQRRHWLALGARHGLVTADGRPASDLIDALVARTPLVMTAVRAQLRGGFPDSAAASILGGLQDAARSVAG